jgi:ech hydrogenase subunit D
MDPQVFIDIRPHEMRQRMEAYHAAGWRFVNICGSTVPGGVEMIYSVSNGEPFENLRFVVENDASLPSVSDLYFNAFFFENETHDLYGVSFKGLALDFGGTLYEVSTPTPMNPASDRVADVTSKEA